MNRFVILPVAVILFNSVAAFSHGLEIQVVLNYPAVISTAMYSADEPAKGIMITVFSASDRAKTYQTGQTDPAGKFAFIPDAEGAWMIIADDGHGHKEETEVTVTSGFFHPQPDEPIEVPVAEVVPVESTVPDMPKSYKILMGLSLLFGITGIYYGFKVKQSHK